VLFFSSRGQVYKEKVWRPADGGTERPRQGHDQHPARWSRAKRITTIIAAARG